MKKSKTTPWTDAKFVPCDLPSSGDAHEALDTQTEAPDSKKTDYVMDVVSLDPKQAPSTRGRRSLEQVLNDSFGSPKVKASNDEV